MPLSRARGRAERGKFGARRGETEDGGSVSHRWSPKNVSYQLRNRADASHASSIRAHERRIGQRRQTPSAPPSGGHREGITAQQV